MPIKPTLFAACRLKVCINGLCKIPNHSAKSFGTTWRIGFRDIYAGEGAHPVCIWEKLNGTNADKFLKKQRPVKCWRAFTHQPAERRMVRVIFKCKLSWRARKRDDVPSVGVPRHQHQTNLVDYAGLTCVRVLKSLADLVYLSRRQS